MRRRNQITTVALCLVVVSMNTGVIAFSRRLPFAKAGRKRFLNSRISYSSSLAFQNNGQEPLKPSNAKLNRFEVTAPFLPSADQPQAIQEIVKRVEQGDKYSIFRYVFGGRRCKTFILLCVFEGRRGRIFILRSVFDGREGKNAILHRLS